MISLSHAFAKFKDPFLIFDVFFFCTSLLGFHHYTSHTMGDSADESIMSSEKASAMIEGGDLRFAEQLKSHGLLASSSLGQHHHSIEDSTLPAMS